MSKFKEADLKPLAERFPLGSTARLRAFLNLTQALTVRGRWLELTAYEGTDKIRSADSVMVSLPEHLAQGPHQFGMVLGSFAGTLIGYEVAHALATSEPASSQALRSAPSIQVAPVVAVVPRGGFLGGLAGSF